MIDATSFPDTVSPVPVRSIERTDAVRSERVRELVDGDASLLEHAGERAGLQLAVIPNDAADRAAAHHDVPAALTRHREAQAFQSAHRLRPDTRGSLGMLCDVERRDDGVVGAGELELLEVELGRFAQIGDRLFDGLALGCRAGLRIQGRVSTFWRGHQNGSEHHGRLSGLSGQCSMTAVQVLMTLSF